MTFTKTTEQDSHYNHLETMSVSDLLLNINKEDSTVPLAVNKALEQIESLVNQILLKINVGGHSLASKMPSLPLVPAPI